MTEISGHSLSGTERVCVSWRSPVLDESDARKMGPVPNGRATGKRMSAPLLRDEGVDFVEQYPIAGVGISIPQRVFF